MSTVMDRVAAARKTARPQIAHQTQPFDPPSAGWVADENLARDIPGAARVLENWFPTRAGARLRGGVARHSTSGLRMVRGAISYTPRGAQKLFSCSNGLIYDVTNPATPLSLISAVSLPARTSDIHWDLNFSTVGADYVIAVNGADKAIVFDGSTWRLLDDATTELAFDAQTANFTVGQTVTGGTSAATGVIVSQTDNGTTGTLRLKTVVGTFVDNETITDALTGSATSNIPSGVTTFPAVTGVATDKFAHVWSHGNRIWYVEKNSKTAWYMPVDSVGGAALDFSLAGVFQGGGFLYVGGSWSQDSGNGSNDRCVFISSTGECAVYTGTNPADAASWSLFGRYQISRPISKDLVKVGGDLLITTVDGIISMSAVTTKDPAALRMSAVTRRIEPEWRAAVAGTAATEIPVLKWTDQNMLLVAFPGAYQTLDIPAIWGSTSSAWGNFLTIWGGGIVDASTSNGLVFACNLESGAWAKFTGFDAHCFGILGAKAYFGSHYGGMFELESGGTDDGRSIYCKYASWPNSFGAKGAYKQVHMCRTTFIASHGFNAKVTASTDYSLNFGSAPSAATVTAGTDVWDVGLWDVATWDSTATKETYDRWCSIGRSGYAISSMVQITHSSDVIPDVELIQQEMTYEVGAVVV